jgi:hypothetical protein
MKNKFDFKDDCKKHARYERSVARQMPTNNNNDFERPLHPRRHSSNHFERPLLGLGFGV